MLDKLSLGKTEVPQNESEVSKHPATVVILNIREARTENFVRELTRRGFQVLRYETRDWRAVFVDMFSFAKAVFKSDFVLCGSVSTFQVPWMLAAKLLRRPCIVDCPMDLTAWPFPESLRWRCLVWITLRIAACILTIKSREYLVDKFGLSARRVTFMESCPDPALIDAAQFATPRFRPRPDTSLLCWSGGHDHHRLERFMPTFQALIDLAANVELLLIADPAQRSIIESKRYAQAAGFGDRVHVLPVIKPAEDFYATMAQCDIWISTLGDDTPQGRHELRMELLEAGLLAKAVLSVRTPAMVEHGLTNGKEVLYIDPSDPRESAQKIAELASNPNARKQLGDHLRARVIQEFSLKQAVDILLDFVALNA